jgi:hypothetical protein
MGDEVPEPIQHAVAILVERFDIDAAVAVGLLRKMSANLGAPAIAVARQILNRKVPVEAIRGFEDDL